MSYNLTDNQVKAINSNNNNILVSASAGSGKTYVLVQRIIKKIENDGIDINEILVVTFTRLAANDMKNKLKNEFYKKKDSALNRTNKLKWIKQINLLNVADITTIDSFCMQLLKKYIYAASLNEVDLLDSNFKLMDESENLLLRQETWEKFSDQLYTDYYEKNNQKIINLVNNFSNDYDDNGLYSVVIQLLKFANVHHNPQDWLKQLSNSYKIKSPITDSDIYKKKMLLIFEPMLRDVKSQINLALKIINRDNKLDKFNGIFININDYICKLNLDKRNWNDIRDYLSAFTISKFPSKKMFSENEQEKIERLKSIKESIKNTINDIKSYFIMPEDLVIKVSKDACEIINELVNVTIQYRDLLTNEKLKKNMLDFNDIEHCAYNILNNPKYPNIINDVQNSYKEIMIDEYQDTNELQDSIFNSISSNKNTRFMVGDIKQSIYGFRQANPKLFKKKIDNYEFYDISKCEISKNVKIHLNDNFRSVYEIDDFVNMIFDKLMDNEFGNADYVHERLNYNAYNSFKLIEGKNQQNKSAVNFIFYNENEVNYSLNLENSSDIEAAVVANKIKNLVGKEKIIDNGKYRYIQYKDIMILSRSKGYNLSLFYVFSKMNIPLSINNVPNYFQDIEIQIILSFLKIIDNCDQDIPLVSVMRSPIFNFDENELSIIRLNNNKDGSYYKSIVDFLNDDLNKSNKKNLYSHLKSFINTLNDFIDFSKLNSVSALIQEIYENTGWNDYVKGMPNGTERYSNLSKFYEIAKLYENDEYHNLNQFINFIEQLKDNKYDFHETGSSQISNSVSAMTIHSSKGLQAPIVILMGIDHHFNVSDNLNSKILINEDGIGIQYFFNKSKIMMQTLQYKIKKYEIQRDLKSEELRLLYVALTRAEQKLFLISGYKNNYSKKQIDKDWKNKLIDKWNNSTNSYYSSMIPLGIRLKAKSYQDWIILCLFNNCHEKILNNLNKSSYYLDNIYVQFIDNTDVSSKLDINLITKNHNNLNNLNNLIINNKRLKNFDYLDSILFGKYSNDIETHISAYQETSNFKNYFDNGLNFEESSVVNFYQGDHNISYNNNFASPSFIETNNINAASVGTAIHLLLKRIDLNKCPTKETLEDELNQLLIDGFINEKIRLYIYKFKLKNILKIFQYNVTNSNYFNLGKELLNGNNKVYREKPFSMIIPANKIFYKATNTPLLLHGIIDGYIIKPNGDAFLFDYKTDHIKNDSDLKKIINKYLIQIRLYTYSLSRILHNSNRIKSYLYFLDINKAIEIN